jgi:hypothetical protein
MIYCRSSYLLQRGSPRCCAKGSLLSPDYSVSEVFEFGKLAGERLNTLVQSETTVVQLRKIIHCTPPTVTVTTWKRWRAVGPSGARA